MTGNCKFYLEHVNKVISECNSSDPISIPSKNTVYQQLFFDKFSGTFFNNKEFMRQLENVTVFHIAFRLITVTRNVNDSNLPKFNPELMQMGFSGWSDLQSFDIKSSLDRYVYFERLDFNENPKLIKISFTRPSTYTFNYLEVDYN